MAKSKGEKVDGPKVAAQILNSMTAPNRARLVEAMKQAAPEITERVAENLFSFEDIVDLASQGVQILIKEIDQRDLVISLKSASQAVKRVLFSNMSERKCASVKEDFEALPKISNTEIEEAQFRILKKLDSLRTEGKIRTDSKKDVYV